MASGALQVFATGTLDGEVAYEVSTTPMRLGGLDNPSTGSTVLPLPPVGGTVEAALLDVAVRSKQPMLTKWRLWLDGIAITREFKPKVVVKLDDTDMYFGKVVFDVKPIFKPSERHHVTIRYEGGDPIVVEHVGLLAAYRVDGARSSFTFMSGGVALAPGDTVVLSVEVPEDTSEFGEARLIVSLPSRSAVLRVRVSGREERITGFVGCDEVRLPITGSGRSFTVEITHLEPSGEKYFPHYALVSTLLLSKVARREPKLEVAAVNEEGDRLLVSVRNSGDSQPEKVILLLLKAGSIVARRELQPIKPGEVAVVELPRVKPAVIRVVWVYHGRPSFTERRI